MRQTQHTVQIFNTPKGWMAKFSRPEILDAFGCDTIPTPFTEKASPMMVLEALKDSNPEDLVTFKTN